MDFLDPPAVRLAVIICFSFKPIQLLSSGLFEAKIVHNVKLVIPMAPFFKWHLTYDCQKNYINLPKLRKINLHPPKNCMAQSCDPNNIAKTAAI